jgi:hypothetical protein
MTMSDNANNYYDQGGRRGAIRNFVLNEMVRGAGWGALVVFGIGFLLWAIYLLGLLLPPESKTAPPPMPFSQVHVIDTTA